MIPHFITLLGLSTALAFAQDRPLDNIASRPGAGDAPAQGRARNHRGSDDLWECFFDSEKCADGIQALRHYRYEVEEAKSDPAGGHIVLSKVPSHDWASHAADAFRTATVMIREPERKKEQEKRRPTGKLSP